MFRYFLTKTLYSLHFLVLFNKSHLFFMFCFFFLNVGLYNVEIQYKTGMSQKCHRWHEEDFVENTFELLKIPQLTWSGHLKIWGWNLHNSKYLWWHMIRVSTVVSQYMASNQQNKDSHEVHKSSIESVNVANILWVDTILFSLEKWKQINWKTTVWKHTHSHFIS